MKFLCKLVVSIPIIFVIGLMSWSYVSFAHTILTHSSPPAALLLLPGTTIVFLLFITAYYKVTTLAKSSFVHGFLEEEGEQGSTILCTREGATRSCTPCGITPKPDRAHHCSNCERCVLKMDHHCPWIGGCVVGAESSLSLSLSLSHTNPSRPSRQSTHIHRACTIKSFSSCFSDTARYTAPYYFSLVWRQRQRYSRLRGKSPSSWPLSAHTRTTSNPREIFFLFECRLEPVSIHLSKFKACICIIFELG